MASWGWFIPPSLCCLLTKGWAFSAVIFFLENVNINLLSLQSHTPLKQDHLHCTHSMLLLLVTQDAVSQDINKILSWLVLYIPFVTPVSFIDLYSVQLIQSQYAADFCLWMGIYHLTVFFTMLVSPQLKHTRSNQCMPKRNPRLALFGDCFIIDEYLVSNI